MKEALIALGDEEEEKKDMTDDMTID